MLTTAGRRIRGAFTAAVLAALLAGAAWGYDDNFPFGPFRMFSYANKLDGRVASAKVEGTTTSGRVITISAGELAFRRAEIEGQVQRFVADPDLLHLFAETYEELNPEAETLASIRLFYAIDHLVDGRKVGDNEQETLAVWERP